MKFILTVLLAFSPWVLADWKLLNDASTINYISIKSGSIAEVNTFKALSGTVDKSGAVDLKINLASVETNIPIRNERMRALLFETERFAEATVSGAIDISRSTNLAVGDTYGDAIKLTLSLHGVSKDVMSNVQITKLTQNRLLVSSAQPVIVNAADYNLAEGVEKLRSIAGLPAISLAVPVTFTLVFSRE